MMNKVMESKINEMKKLEDDVAYLSMPGLRLSMSEMAELRWKSRRLAALKEELGVKYTYTDTRIGFIAGTRHKHNRSYIR